MRSPDELRALVEAYLEELRLSEELGGLVEPMRYALEGGGKRIRPVLCLATGEAAGAEPEEVLPAAAAVELVHTFSLVHDDLPSLDDDPVRRGRASAHVEFGEGVAVIAGDALLAEAFRLAATYRTPGVVRELAEATLGMIGGQHLDLTQAEHDAASLHRLKTGRLFDAAVGCALRVAGVSEADQTPWRAFGGELGLLFQLVDDILDGDGYVERHGAERARALADEAAERAQERLAGIGADTSVLRELVAGLAARTS
jgi:geranylgeranyl diphosphate synthase type II